METRKVIVGIGVDRKIDLQYNHPYSCGLCGHTWKLWGPKDPTVNLINCLRCNAPPEQTSEANISACGLYRYALWRQWGDGPQVVFIMLNPSTADAKQDDPTIRRCIGFARRWQYDGIRVINLFALRSTSPNVLKTYTDPEGPENYETQKFILGRAAKMGWFVVAAWGGQGYRYKKQVKSVVELCRVLDIRLLCFDITKNGSPKHPLYVRGDQLLTDYHLPGEKVWF